MAEAILAGDEPVRAQVVCARGHVTDVFVNFDDDVVAHVTSCPRPTCAHRADWRRARPLVPLLRGRQDDTPAGY